MKNSRESKFKRLLSLALALILVVSMMPMTGLTAKAADYADGDYELFSGSQAINSWGYRFSIDGVDWSKVPAGSQLVVTGDMISEGAAETYACFHILDSSWNQVNALHDFSWNYDSGNGGIQTKKITLSAEDIAYAAANGGLGIQGVSWTLTKLVLHVGPAYNPGENTIYNASKTFASDWGTKADIPVDDWSLVPVGSQLIVYGQPTEGATSAAFKLITSNGPWTDVATGFGFDHTSTSLQSRTITLTSEVLDAAIANGNLAIQGGGWTLKKIVLMVYPDYAGTTGFSGSTAMGTDWDIREAINVNWSNVEAGSLLELNITKAASTYANFKIVDGSWNKAPNIPVLEWDYTLGGTQKMLIKLDAETIALAISNGGLGVQGQNFTLTKAVVYPPTAPHVHGSWTYAVESTSKLTATCGAAGCTSPAKKLTLTISASETNYNGTAATISIGTTAERTAWTEAGLALPTTVEYYKATTKLDAAPTTTGSYKAKVTIDSATAEVSYTIIPTQAEVDQAAADDVIAKIDAIGTVEYTEASKTKIDTARNAFDALTADQKALVTNKTTLTTAESTYADLKAAADKAAADQAAADAVIAKIDAIGTVEYSDASKAKIDAAKEALAALTADQKALVTNETTLTAAESTYADLKAAALKAAADQAAADEVIAKIDAIGTVEYSDAFKEKVLAAKEAYDALTDDQKALVNNSETIAAALSSYNTLKEAYEQDAEAVAANLAAANAVIEKIDAIGTVEYTDASKAKIDAAKEALAALTADQKALVTNTVKLSTAESTYADLKAAAEAAAAKAAADQAAADEVIAKIDAIGTVEYTDASKAKIDTAKEALAALTTDQKALVTNADKLTAAEKTYADLKTTAEEEAAKKAAEEEAAKKAAEEKAANEAAAKAVSEKIDAIGTVEYTEASKEKIDAASEAYAALTEAQKALVANYTTFQTAESTYAALKAEAEAPVVPATGDSSQLNVVYAFILVLAGAVLTLEAKAKKNATNC